MALNRPTSSLVRALAYAGTHDPEDIAIGVGEGRFQSWEGDASTIVTEILLTPKRKTLHFFLAEGDLRELRVMLPMILHWGRQQGCTHASLVGRFGWLRSFVRDFGFREEATLMGATL